MFLLRKISLLLPILLWSSSVLAEQLATLRGGDVQAELHLVGSEIELRITAASGNKSLASKLHVFPLEGPSRLVVDIADVRARSADAVDVSEAGLKALRMGVHPDKTRLVIDILGKKYPRYEVFSGSRSSQAVVRFSLSGSAQVGTPKSSPEVSPKRTVSRIEKIPKPKRVEAKLEGRAPGPPRAVRTEPAPTPTREPGDMLHEERQSGSEDVRVTHDVEQVERSQVRMDLQERLKMLALEEGSELAALEDRPTIPIEPDVARPGVATVNGIRFDSSPEGDKYSVVIAASGIEEYSLRRKEEGRYELVIVDAAFDGGYLAFPHFPPRDFLGLQVVVGSESKDGVVFSFHVDSGARLVPHRSDEGLRVQVAP